MAGTDPIIETVMHDQHQIELVWRLQATPPTVGWKVRVGDQKFGSFSIVNPTSSREQLKKAAIQEAAKTIRRVLN